MAKWKKITINKNSVAAEELLRLKQISGLASLFKNKEFSQVGELP